LLEPLYKFDDDDGSCGGANCDCEVLQYPNRLSSLFSLRFPKRLFSLFSFMLRPPVDESRLDGSENGGLGSGGGVALAIEVVGCPAASEFSLGCFEFMADADWICVELRSGRVESLIALGTDVAVDGNKK
jgi:hypothetical protein